MNRYHRQIILPDIGHHGQDAISNAHACVIGCGALGCCSAELLTRAGIGKLTLIDRDVVEETNLQRQVLFSECDAENAMPKAEAAKLRLQSINSTTEIEPQVQDLDATNVGQLIGSADLIIDGLDNFESRYLVNDFAVHQGRAYLYGGAVGTTGLAMPILPHPTSRLATPGVEPNWSESDATPCLRCLFPEPPAAGSTPTCDTAGVLASIVTIVASFQVSEAIKIITGNLERLDRSLFSIDLWSNLTHRTDTSTARNNTCPCCALGHFEFLDRQREQTTSTLCGRSAVQIWPTDLAMSGSVSSVNLDALLSQLAPHGDFRTNGHLIHGSFTHEQGDQDDPIRLLLFPNGRAVISGTSQTARARTLYARYVGM